MKLYFFYVIKKIKHIAGRAVLPLAQKNQRIMGIIRRLNDRLNSALLQNTLPPVTPIKKNEGILGINLAGYITSESGVGEAARSSIRALEEIGIPYVLNNLPSPHRQGDNTYHNFAEDNPYSFNLIHLNADGVMHFSASGRLDYLANKYNIGFWFWELSEFPAEWLDRFQFLDEVWTASNFCADAFSQASPIPVIRIPLSVHINELKNIKRSHFGLSDDQFIFLFMFDFYSVFERKNPLAVIEAFKLAFPSQEDVLLLLKCSNSQGNPEARSRLMKAAKGLNVKLIDGYLNKEELHALMAASDGYVSLHRSEGFGLPLAEAMYLGKPVIATAYSGNMDFMNINNSFLIKYRLVELQKDYYPYKKGNIWAQPDVEHAAELMRLVYENRELARKVGGIASQDIKTYLNPRTQGQKILQRLEHIMDHQRLAPHPFPLSPV